MQVARKFALRLFILAAVFSSTFSLHISLANDKKAEQAEAQALLDKARALTDVEAAGNPAFGMVADAHFIVGKTLTDGQFILSWASPVLYRTEFTLPWFHQLEIVSGGKLFRMRDADYLPYEVETWLSMFAMTQNFTLSSAKPAKPKEIPSQWKGRAGVSCITGSAGRQKATLCIDTATSEIVGLEVKLGFTRPELWTFDNYVALGDKRFPGRITARYPQGFDAEIDVQRIAVASAFASGTFMPATGAVPHQWCQHPSFRGPTSNDEPFGSRIMMDGGSSFPRGDPIVAYLLIGPKGTVEKYMLLHPEQSKMNEPTLAWLKKPNYPTEVCNNTPIQYETFFVMSRLH